MSQEATLRLLGRLKKGIFIRPRHQPEARDLDDQESASLIMRNSDGVARLEPPGRCITLRAAPFESVHRRLTKPHVLDDQTRNLAARPSKSGAAERG